MTDCLLHSGFCSMDYLAAGKLDDIPISILHSLLASFLQYAEAEQRLYDGQNPGLASDEGLESDASGNLRLRSSASEEETASED